jgi:tetratricopeptide (TPR) repeat protein
VLVNKAGEEIDRIVGYLPPEEFVQKIDDYQNGVGTLDDLLSQADTLVDRELFIEIADKYKYRGGMEEAKLWFQRVIDEGDAKDSLSGESRMSLADMLRRAKEYEKARSAFSKIKKDFKGTMFSEAAEIWTAIVYRQEGDTAQAIKAFEGFVKNYPQSEDVEYATEQIKKLKGEVDEETN